MCEETTQNAFFGFIKKNINFFSVFLYEKKWRKKFSSLPKTDRVFMLIFLLSQKDFGSRSFLLLLHTIFFLSHSLSRLSFVVRHLMWINLDILFMVVTVKCFCLNCM